MNNQQNTAQLPQIDKVLLVDDDDNWNFIYKMLLEDTGVGKQIITAKNGREALQQLQTFAKNGERLPELVFLDIKMPVMDGFEVLEELTKSQVLNLSHTKIFMCTSSFLTKDKEKAKLYPVAGFINKPLTQEVLTDILAGFSV